MKQRGNSALHFLDRYVGIPAIALLGCARAKRSLPSSIERVGLLKLAAIGDTVLMGAIVADLRSALPHASIVLFVGRSNLEIAGMLEGVDQIIQVSTDRPWAGLKTIRSAAVDVLLDFGQWSRLEALFCLQSRAHFTVGFRTPGQHRHWGYDWVVGHSSQVHELENFRLLGRALGTKANNVPVLTVSGQSHRSRQPYAAFHLWPGGRRRKLKEWPMDRWLRLVEEFARLGLDVELTGASADRSRNDTLIASLPSSVRGFVKNAAGLSLRNSAAILSGATLVVSVDTGLMHMAAALGVPLVALHGPTSSRRWGPVSSKAVVVESQLEGSGFISLGWESPEAPPACMESITYEAVRDVCLRLLGKQSGPPRGRSEELTSTPTAEDETHETVGNG
jgi:ADP-heptose:LPS heptosyltransferase